MPAASCTGTAEGSCTADRKLAAGEAEARTGSRNPAAAVGSSSMHREVAAGDSRRPTSAAAGKGRGIPAGSSRRESARRIERVRERGMLKTAPAARRRNSWGK